MIGAGLGLVGNGFDGSEVGGEIGVGEVVVRDPAVALDAPPADQEFRTRNIRLSSSYIRVRWSYIFGLCIEG